MFIWDFVADTVLGQHRGLDLWPNDLDVHWGIFRSPVVRDGGRAVRRLWTGSRRLSTCFLPEKLAWALHDGGTCEFGGIWVLLTWRCQSGSGGKPRSVIHGAEMHCWIYGGRPFSFRCAGGAFCQVQCVPAGRDNQRGITGMGRVTSAPWQGNIIDESAEFRPCRMQNGQRSVWRNPCRPPSKSTVINILFSNSGYSTP